MTHIITIEANLAGDAVEYRPRCTCGYEGDWYNSTEFENTHENASGDVTRDGDGVVAAFDAATAAGDDHLDGLEFGHGC
jgi:hypothetical protein